MDAVLIPDWLLIVVLAFKIVLSLHEAIRRRDYLLAFLAVPLGWLLFFFLINLLHPMLFDTEPDREAVFRPGFLFLLLINAFILIDGDVNCYAQGFFKWLRMRLKG